MLNEICIYIYIYIYQCIDLAQGHAYRASIVNQTHNSGNKL